MTMTKHGPLMLGGSVNRLSWTSESKTGMFNAHNHKQGRDLERNFYITSHGYYWKPPTSTSILNFINTVVSFKSNNKK